MRGLARGALAALAAAAAAFGVWLITTIDREFAPRGVVGAWSLILAAALGGVAVIAWRHPH